MISSRIDAVFLILIIKYANSQNVLYMVTEFCWKANVCQDLSKCNPADVSAAYTVHTAQTGTDRTVRILLVFFCSLQTNKCKFRQLYSLCASCIVHHSIVMHYKMHLPFGLLCHFVFDIIWGVKQRFCTEIEIFSCLWELQHLRIFQGYARFRIFRWAFISTYELNWNLNLSDRKRTVKSSVTSQQDESWFESWWPLQLHVFSMFSLDALLSSYNLRHAVRSIGESVCNPEQVVSPPQGTYTSFTVTLWASN